MAENVNLFLDNIFDENSQPSPNKVTLYFYNYDVNGATGYMTSKTLCGLLASEPTISTQNQWGPMFGDIANLTNLSNLLEEKSLFTWIGASAQTWKGTKPISVGVDFYLINYKPNGLNFEEKLRALTNLTALAEVAGTEAMKHTSVAVHGGYNVNFLTTNKEMQNLKMFQDSNFVKNNSVQLESYGSQLLKGQKLPQGVLTLKIGNKTKIENLLLTRLDVTPSLAEVEEGKALFYRVNAAFIGARPLVVADVKEMYKQ